MTKIFFIILLSSFVQKGMAQFSGNNLMETQLGNIPEQEPDDLKTFYDQINLQYNWKGFRAFTRLEQFYSSMPDGNNYTTFSQYSLNYERRGLEAKLGNFYETLGRGLLFRGYEIKGSVFEDRIYRARQGFYKDVRGAYLRYGNSWFEVKALRGKNLAGQLPPDHPDNRPDLVTAGELVFFVKNQQLGAIYLDNENTGGHSRYLDFHIGGTVSEKFDYYGELAHRLNDQIGFLKFDEESSYGAYISLNYSERNLGISLEMKDYHNFLIGSGLADPPTLVKEQSYKLLNRSTHVGELLDERGIQLEVFYQLSDDSRLTLNHSRIENDFFKVYHFQEYFGEWYTDLKSVQIKTFLDYSFDEFKQEDKRFTGGVYLTRPLPKSWALRLETEAQQIRRTYGDSPTFQNYYLGVIGSKSSRYSAALVWEFTNDEYLADRSSTSRIEKSRQYWSVNFSYKPNSRNTIQFFAGTRRGGPACTSGVCYEVLDFKGLELRWATRF